ncbi:acyl carrier protein [Geodermatophilus sp. CPCC 205506]|uniref:acyl carrier protein n=1 Tax=Geodermatophilus sp. CPCC 205506 TaxID=2936596 RepID=UPI003EE8AF3A
MSESPDVATVRATVLQAVGPDALDGAGDDEPLFEQRLLDSLALVSIVTAIEDRFGISVAPEDLVPANFRSITDMARFVSGKRATR